MGFKLEKLKIIAYTDADYTKRVKRPFEAMFNPQTYKHSYGIDWFAEAALNASGAQLSYTRSPPSELSLDLLLDGTGVHEMGIFGLNPFRKSVQKRVDEFLALTYGYNGSIHEPNYLVVAWGNLRFRCRLSSVEVKYTAFNRDGTPMRAELAVRFISDIALKKMLKQQGKRSPDLTHSRIVRGGDTLPLLTKEIYGSSAYYLEIARINNLDDFRNLTPGQELFFPPLKSFAPDADTTEEA